jgi:hypothetical protein
MVDVVPWGGNYSGTVVRNNTIIGGFATDSKSSSQNNGQNVDDVIIKFVPFRYTRSLLTDFIELASPLGLRRGSSTSLVPMSAPRVPP